MRAWTGIEAPTTARYHQQQVDQILASIQEGIYCVVLGPRLCGKTVLLRYVEHIIKKSMGMPCVYIDLLTLSASTQSGFFDDLIQLTAANLQSEVDLQLISPTRGSTSSAVFRGFLYECVQNIGSDLVLIIEHLETLPLDLAQALLTSLRAAFMDQQTMEQRVIVVLSGALSLATLTVGESSPFRGIARRIFVGDLSKTESHALISEYLEEMHVDLTFHAVQNLLRATSGDGYLIRTMCERTSEMAISMNSQRLRAGEVNQVLRKYLSEEVFQYEPLLEAVRLIEDDPDLLHSILILLDRQPVPKAELPLPLSPDLDPLYLTGIVEQVDEDQYRLQNLIYQKFLERYFTAGRVGHMMSIAGRWDSALDYLESGVRMGDQGARADLLPATIQSIYAAEDQAQAARFLLRGLAAGFGIQHAQVWYSPAHQSRLRLIGSLGENRKEEDRIGAEMAETQDRLESRAFRQRQTLRGKENAGYVWRAIPLMAPGQAPIGVISIDDELTDNRFSEQRAREMSLVGYLHQVARAFQAVSVRRQELTLAGRMQASLLPGELPEIDGWKFSAAWIPARETSGDFYDYIPLEAGRLGIAIADVVDKGMGAALYMALSRTLLRTYAADYPERPDLALQAANQRMLAEAGGGHFVTLFFGVLEPTNGNLLYCNAGHNPPLLFPSPETTEPIALQRTGMALGVQEIGEWNLQSIDLPPNATLLFYTDGLVDALDPGGQPFGLERLITAMQPNLALPAQTIQDAILSAVQTFVAGAPQVDDMTMVVVQRAP